MSPSEYDQLVEFLGPRFETIDRRLEQEYHAITQALRHAKIEDLERRLRLDRQSRRGYNPAPCRFAGTGSAPR